MKRVVEDVNPYKIIICFGRIDQIFSYIPSSLRSSVFHRSFVAQKNFDSATASRFAPLRMTLRNNAGALTVIKEGKTPLVVFPREPRLAPPFGRFWTIGVFRPLRRARRAPRPPLRKLLRKA